jgi:tRNA(Ile)-lysidine synthase
MTAHPPPRPLRSREFAACMVPLGPFEAAPVLAVAVSGGADSLALTLLADSWARRRGGRAVGLTVDHGLRPEAAAEARRVAGWLQASGIEHHTLRWRGEKPAHGVQAAARDARYRLLTGWCRAHDVLHLLTAHHRDDQAETVLLRLDRGSGLHGLAGMATVRAEGGVRLLRPLLAVPGVRLAATLRAAGQPWIEDPSNRDVAYARVRARRALAGLRDGGFGAGMLADLAGEAAVVRRADERRLAEDAAAAVDLHAAGYALLRAAWWRAAAPARRRLLLGALLRTVGGLDFPPRGGRLDALIDRLGRDFGIAGATLAGCRLLPCGGDMLVCREPGRLPRPIAIRPGEHRRWDRFDVRFSGKKTEKTVDWQVGPLRRDGWAQIAGEVGLRPPPAVRAALPALHADGRIAAVPHLGYADPGCGLNRRTFSAIFAPPLPLVPAFSAVV